MAGQHTAAELERAKASLADASLRGEERMAAIERALELRRQLINDNPNNFQRPVWLADQASDLIFECLGHEGLGIVAMFGSPTPTQRERARQAAREAFDSAAEAEAAVAKVIASIESMPGLAADSNLQQVRRDLAEVQRDRRIPYLRGISSHIHAHLNVADPIQQRTHFSMADRVLSALDDKLQGSPAIEARLYAGLAKARLGEFDAAETLFAAVARDTSATVPQIFMARMGGVMNRTIRNGARAGLEALATVEQRYTDAGVASNLFYRIVIADHAFGLRRQLARQADGAQRDSLLADAFAVYTTLLKADLGSSREIVRAIVFARLTNAITLDDRIPLDSMPGLVKVAYAEHLSRQSSTRERAIVLLEDALNRGQLDAESLPAALFVLARALLEHDERLFAARRFIELASRYPADHQAQRAIELGVTIASELRRKSPTDAEAQSLLREGLAVLLEKYPNLPSINHWRYSAARLAIDESRHDDALHLLQQITPDAAEWPDAHFMQAAAERARALTAPPDDVVGLNRQVIAAIDRVQPIIEASHASAGAERRKALRDYRGLLHVYRAEALLRMNQPQAALQAVAAIEREPDVSGLVVGEALRVRINAYQALRQPDDAQRAIEQFASSSPGQVIQVLPSVLAAMRREVETLLNIGRESEARELASRTMLPTAEILEQATHQMNDDDPGSAVIRQHIASAYLLSGRFTEAAARYDRLLRAAPDAAEILLGRAEALFGMRGEQQLAQAMSIYKRLAATGPEHNAEHYWLSQLRMLQILDLVSRNTDQIPPRVERLRQHDANLGGDRFKSGFEALRVKYAGRASP